MSDTPSTEFSLQELQGRFSKEYQALKRANSNVSTSLGVLILISLAVVLYLFILFSTRNNGNPIGIGYTIPPILAEAYAVLGVGYTRRPSKMEPLKLRVEEAGNAYARLVFSSADWRILRVDRVKGEVLATPLRPGNVDISGVTFYASHTGDPGLNIRPRGEGISAKRNAQIAAAPWYQEAISSPGSDTVSAPAASCPA